MATVDPLCARCHHPESDHEREEDHSYCLGNGGHCPCKEFKMPVRDVANRRSRLHRALDVMMDRVGEKVRDASNPEVLLQQAEEASQKADNENSARSHNIAARLYHAAARVYESEHRDHAQVIKCLQEARSHEMTANYLNRQGK